MHALEEGQWEEGAGSGREQRVGAAGSGGSVGGKESVGEGCKQWQEGGSEGRGGAVRGRWCKGRRVRQVMV